MDNGISYPKECIRVKKRVMKERKKQKLQDQKKHPWRMETYQH